MSQDTKSPLDLKFVSFLRTRYSPVPKNDQEKIIEGIQSFLLSTKDKNANLKTVLDNAARTIYRLFEFKEIAIGLKNTDDGLYRYEVTLGFRHEAELAYKRLVYTYDEMVSAEKYPFVNLSKTTEYCTSEGMKSDKKEDLISYNRPQVISLQRDSMERFIEGDYIEINIYGYDKELIAWIELANTKNGMLPDRTNLKWIELIGSIIGTVIQREISEKKAMKRRGN